MLEPVSLLVEKGNADGADVTFRRIIECIHLARSSIRIHMFVWRADGIGNSIADALISAADRGIKIHITKDTDAFLYECIEMNRQPLFKKNLPSSKRLVYKLMSYTFPDTYIHDSFTDDAGQRLMSHKNVTMEWVHHTHAKYYIFDDELMLTGSINIEDRHRGYWDYMVELRGNQWIKHFEQRNTGKVPLDETREIDFILNRVVTGISEFEIKPFMLQRLATAKSSVYIEMAYIGDPDISEAIIQASNRGIDITVMFSRVANVGNDINYKTLYDIASHSRVKVFFAQKMIHSKLILFDGETVLMGSANVSVYSMQKGAELDLVISGNPVFMQALNEEIQRRIAMSEAVNDVKRLKIYNPFLAFLQQLHQQLA